MEKPAAFFESFTQAHGSVARRFGGTGLTIARALVPKKMGGEIWLECKPGARSTFQFTKSFRLSAQPEQGLAPGPLHPVTEEWHRRDAFAYSGGRGTMSSTSELRRESWERQGTSPRWFRMAAKLGQR